MYKFFCSIFLFLTIIYSYSQEYEIGPMFNLERTSFNIPDNSFIVIGGPGTGSKGSRTTGYENNISGGIYGSYFFSEQLAFSAELFYTKTSATEFGNKSFSSINFIPYLTYGFFNEIPLFLNLGGGIAYMVKTPDFGDDYSIEANEIKKVDIPLKFSIFYNVKDFFLI